MCNSAKFSSIVVCLYRMVLQVSTSSTVRRVQSQGISTYFHIKVSSIVIRKMALGGSPYIHEHEVEYKNLRKVSKLWAV